MLTSGGKVHDTPKPLRCLRPSQGAGPGVNGADVVLEPAPPSLGISLMPMDRDPGRDAKVAVVTVRGEVDLATSPQVYRVLSDLLERGRVDLVVDLEAVEFIDASGIGVLVDIASNAETVGGSVVLRRPSRRVLRVLDLLQLDGVLAIEDSCGHSPSS